MVSLAGLASLAGYACPQSSICNLKSAIFPMLHAPCPMLKTHPCMWKEYYLALEAAQVDECKEILRILETSLAVIRSA